MSRYQIPKSIAIRARLLEAAMVLGRGRNLSVGMDDAQKYLNREEAGVYSTKKWKVDRKITVLGGKRLLVTVNRSKRTVAINIAGTKLSYDPHGIDDVALDIQMVNGKEIDNHPQIVEGLQVVQAVKHKYRGYKIEINGFSLGGAKAIHIGNIEGIPTFTFNPHTISMWLLNSVPHPGITHHIYRTHHDFPSRGGYVLMNQYPGNYEVHAYDHLRVNDTPSDRWDIHSMYRGLEKPHRLNNFYLYRSRVGSRRRPREGVDVAPTFQKRKSRKSSRRRQGRMPSRRRS